MVEPAARPQACYYANRLRGERAQAEPAEAEAEEHPVKKRRCSASWARLIAKVYHVDPLMCPKCGDERPPPPDVRYVPVDDEGREITTFS